MDSIEDFLSESEKYKFSDDDTYAVRDLKRILNARRFYKFINTIPKKYKIDTWHLYYYISGRIHNVGNIYVYALRNVIQPSMWYYKVTETLPKPIKFDDKNISAESFLGKDSCAHLLLKELRAEKYGTTQAMAEAHEMSFMRIKNVLLKYTAKNGKEHFKSLPTPSFIDAYKTEINPDYWYIFPEELTTIKERERFERLALKYNT